MKFEILGKPVAKARPRLNKFGYTYTPEKTVNYENLVRYTFQSEFPNHKPFEEVIEASITAIFEVPKSYSKKKTKELLETHNNYNHKPDLDNIAKIILDSLNGIAYRDDSQVTILHLNKEYGEQAKVVVELKEIKSE
jgi:Holliday junction resolvase RusA-like endonuclease